MYYYNYILKHNYNIQLKGLQFSILLEFLI